MRRPACSRPGLPPGGKRMDARRPGRRPSDHHRNDDGLTLVELMVAFACLIVLLTIAASALTTYVTAGTTVISSYSATDQLLPSSMVIQRLIRSEVEPAPMPPTNSSCAVANASCPPFLTGSVGTFSTTFYANIGDANGPAKIVMAESTPTECSSCRFYTSVFTVTEYPAVASTCPFSETSTATCSWSSSGKVLVDISSVVNGAAPLTVGSVTTTPLPYASTPIFTYNTLDTVSNDYVPGAGGSTVGTTGMLSGFGTACTPPSTTSQNCPQDTIQSVGVDLEVEVQGSPAHENYFVVYRLSSSSYLYSPLVG